MLSYVTRQGKLIPADEAFHAWNSGDLKRMLAALDAPTNPVDRHFLLSSIAAIAYKQRTLSKSRHLCKEIARRHVREFPTMAAALVADLGVLPRVPTFAVLATVLAEDGEYEEAIQVCRSAQALGLHDGTKGDYAGRIERILKNQARANSRDA